MNFEVRIPHLGLFTLASHIQQRKQFSYFGLNISEVGKNDNATIDAWYKYNEKLLEFILDTQKIFPIDKYNELSAV